MSELDKSEEPHTTSTNTFHPGEFSELAKESYRWLREYRIKEEKRRQRLLRYRREMDLSDAEVEELPFFSPPSKHFIATPFDRRKIWFILPAHAVMPDLVLPLIYCGSTLTEAYLFFKTVACLKTKSFKNVTLPTAMPECYVDRLIKNNRLLPFLAACRTALQLNQTVRVQFKRLVAKWLLKRKVIQANETDILTGETPHKPVHLIDWPNRRCYVFEATTLFKDYIGRLTLSEFLHPTGQMPRNPFTNLTLTIGQLISLTDQLGIIGDPLCRHWVFEAFRSSQYLIDIFKDRFSLPLKIHALKKTFIDKLSDDYYYLMFDFIEDEHERHDSPHFNRGVYQWALKHQVDSHRILKWHAACFKYHQIHIESHSAKEIDDKDENIIGPMTESLCDTPTDLIVLRDHWHKRELLEKRKKRLEKKNEL